MFFYVIEYDIFVNVYSVVTIYIYYFFSFRFFYVFFELWWHAWSI